MRRAASRAAMKFTIVYSPSCFYHVLLIARKTSTASCFLAQLSMGMRKTVECRPARNMLLLCEVGQEKAVIKYKRQELFTRSARALSRIRGYIAPCSSSSSSCGIRSKAQYDFECVRELSAIFLQQSAKLKFGEAWNSFVAFKALKVQKKYEQHLNRKQICKKWGSCHHAFIYKLTAGVAPPPPRAFFAGTTTGV